MSLRSFSRFICISGVCFGVLSGCISEKPSSATHIESSTHRVSLNKRAPTWGSGSFIIGSGSTTLRVDFGSGLTIYGTGFPGYDGICKLNHDKSKWTCTQVNFSVFGTSFISAISMNNNTTKSYMDSVRSAGYYLPQLLTGSYIGHYNGQNVRSQVVRMWDKYDTGSVVINAFVGPVNVWTYPNTLADIPKILDAIYVQDATPADISSFDKDVFERDIRAPYTKRVLSIGNKRFSLPKGYVAGPTETWAGGRAEPNGYCVNVESPRKPSVRDNIVIPVMSGSNRYNSLTFSAPDLCQSLIEADHYCFATVNKTATFGQKKIQMRYTYNDPNALDWKHQNEQSGDVPCKSYAKTPDKIVSVDFCTNAICMHADQINPSTLENVIAGMKELQ